MYSISLQQLKQLNNYLCTTDNKANTSGTLPHKTPDFYLNPALSQGFKAD